MCGHGGLWFQACRRHRLLHEATSSMWMWSMCRNDQDSLERQQVRWLEDNESGGKPTTHGMRQDHAFVLSPDPGMLFDLVFSCTSVWAVTG